VVLINTLGLTELVSDALGNRKQKEAETNAKIVDLLKHALDETKNYRTEQQMVEFHIALNCVMTVRETQGTNNGWITRICERLDIIHSKERTMTGKITLPILVAQHLRSTFCKKECFMEHVNTQINQVVVMYRSSEKVIRPPALIDISVYKDIMSCFSFLFLGVVRHYAKRPFSC
jgi:hypothetical protein